MRWNSTRIPELEAMLARQPPESLAHLLTRAQLALARNAQDEATRLLTCATRRFLEGQTKDHGVRIRLFTMLLVAEGFDTATDLIRELYKVDCTFNFMNEPNAVTSNSAILWTVRDASTCSFSFRRSLFQTDQTDTVNRFSAWFELFTTFLHSGDVRAGATYVDVGDVGTTPGLVCCDYREGSFAVPDALFCQSRGHQAKRQLSLKHWVPWEQRIPKVFWRGTCTGRMTAGWRSLQRIKLCEMARDFGRADLFDVAVARFTQHMNEEVRAEIQASGLMRPPVPGEEFGKYKYQIEIPGNGYSVSWQGLIHKLCTGSPILKIPSPLGHTQWYFDRLRPWYNFVPIAADMADLEEKAVWLERHDGHARAIGSRGRELVESLDYEAELKAATKTISAAMAHHSYRFGDVAPCMDA